MRRILGGALCAAVLTSWVVLGGPPADPGPGSGGVPTRSRLTAIDGRPVDVAFPVGYLGVRWDGDATGGAVRFRHAERWTAWQALQPDGAHAEHGTFVSGLVWADRADAYQVRLPVGTAHAKAMAIDTSGAARGSSRHGEGVASAATSVVTRAEWGADESIRKGTPTYYPAQKITVHHTATRNDDPDPAATVRAIYEWHVNGNGWDDIGYQYLVDESGRVYEGRWSGTDGDPAHDVDGDVVTGAHVAGMNSGNVGIALLGTLTDRQPTAAARGALEQLLGELTSRHGLDPEATSTYVNPVSGARRDVANISGHRDWEATECPGSALYALLPSIRSAVAASSGTVTSTTTSSTSTSSSTVPPSTTTTTKRPPKKRR